MQSDIPGAPGCNSLSSLGERVLIHSCNTLMVLDLMQISVIFPLGGMPTCTKLSTLAMIPTDKPANLRSTRHRCLPHPHPLSRQRRHRDPHPPPTRRSPHQRPQPWHPHLPSRTVSSSSPPASLHLRAVSASGL